MRIIPWVDIQMCAHAARVFLKDRQGARRQLRAGNVGHGCHRQKKTPQHVIPQSPVGLKSVKWCCPFTKRINYILKPHTNCTGIFFPN